MEDETSRKEKLGTIQLGKTYIDLLKIVAKSQTPRTSMRQHTERWIVGEASRLGLLNKKPRI